MRAHRFDRGRPVAYTLSDGQGRDIRVVRRVIARADEEGACQGCGFPLFVGDRAHDVDDGEGLACGKACAVRVLGKLRLRELEAELEALGRCGLCGFGPCRCAS